MYHPLHQSMENALTFGNQAKSYAAARPSYPEELFGWIERHAPQTELAWDVGTGSGQAAKSLARRFSKVHATDIDAAQIAQCENHPKINFQQAAAEASGLSENSVDAITVATALHWFDHSRFWCEVERVARKGAVFCAWTYHRTVVDDLVQQQLLDPMLEIIDDYWSEENRLSWRGYSKHELNMPFDLLTTPSFSMHLTWTPEQIAALASTWSAYHRASLDGHAEALSNIATVAIRKIGNEPRQMQLPLHVTAARIG